MHDMRIVCSEDKGGNHVWNSSRKQVIFSVHEIRSNSYTASAPWYEHTHSKLQQKAWGGIESYPEGLEDRKIWLQIPVNELFSIMGIS